MSHGSDELVTRGYRQETLAARCDLELGRTVARNEGDEPARGPGSSRLSSRARERLHGSEKLLRRQGYRAWEGGRDVDTAKAGEVCGKGASREGRKEVGLDVINARTWRYLLPGHRI